MYESSEKYGKESSRSVQLELTWVHTILTFPKV